jgi:arylsulfatase A-like enzyme
VKPHYLLALLSSTIVIAAGSRATTQAPEQPAGLMPVTFEDETRPALRLENESRVVAFAMNDRVAGVRIAIGQASGRAADVEAALAFTDATDHELGRRTVSATASVDRWTETDVPLSVADMRAAKVVVTFTARRAAGDPASPVFVAATPLEVQDGSAPNVILISIDTLRADRLSAYGYPLETSPNIRQLAAQGTLFERAISQASSTPPSHGAMLTGLYPARTGLFILRDVGGTHGGLSGYRMKDAVETLPERLKRRGYYTAAFTGGGYLSHGFGFNDGFDCFHEDNDSRPDELMRGGSGALRWVDANKDKKFFLFFHTYEVHNKEAVYPNHYFDLGSPLSFYTSHYRELQDAPEMNARYDSGIVFTDLVLGRLFHLLDDLGLRDKTLIVLTSDHGESMGERAERNGYRYNHGYSFFDELVHVPLVFALPRRVPAGLRIARQVESVDIVPTVLDLIGERGAGKDLDGMTLAPLFAGRTAAYTKTYAYSESLSRGPLRAALRTDRFKYVRVFEGGLSVGPPLPNISPEELYDLQKDPDERVNIAGTPEAQPTLGEFRRAIQSYFQRTGVLELIRSAAAK